MGWVDQVEHLHHIALLQQQRSHGPDKFPLGVGGNEAGVGQHQVGLDHIAGLACAAAAHNDLQQVPQVLPAVEAHA